jgi:hypothetical protein
MIDWENLAVYWLLIGSGMVCLGNFLHGRQGTHAKHWQDLVLLVLGPVALLATFFHAIGMMSRRGERGGSLTRR